MILIIPDVHGRTFWSLPCKNLIKDVDKVIFLGDYVDPYPDESTPTKTITQLKRIIEFRDKHPDKVILLLGNHDYFYISDLYRKSFRHWSRHDYEHDKDIMKIFKDNIKKFQIAWQCNNKKYGKVLFTHAGINKNFEEICGLDADEINEFFLNGKSETGIPNVMELTTVSWYRGGDETYGSPIWADVREHLNNPVTKCFQIFGHTYCTKIISNEHFAMLDVGKSAFILNENGITPYDEVY